MKNYLLTGVLLLALTSCASSTPGSYENTNKNTVDSAPLSSGSTLSTSSNTFTREIVATHNTSSDCWAIIDGKVYDLTKWEDEHPGGKAAILRSCGKDITKESMSHPGGAFDSSKIQNILKKFYKGDIVE